jgi:hypothetical protein
MKQYIFFENKTEYSFSEDILNEYFIGKLMFAFLDIDWTYLLADACNELEANRENEKGYVFISSYCQRLCAKLRQYHPVLQDVVADSINQIIKQTYADELPMAADFALRFFNEYPSETYSPETIEFMFAEGNFPKWPLNKVGLSFLEEIIKAFKEFLDFSKELTFMILFTLDDAGDYSELTSKQRYYLMQVSNFAPFLKYKDLYKRLGIERKMLDADEIDYAIHDRIMPEVVEKIKSYRLDSYTFYTCDDIRALVLLEFEYMCTNNMAIRRCENCGRYFLPFSVVSRYCDRPVEGKDKTCKEIGAALKFSEKVSGDDIKLAFRRANNAYQMRCRRYPQSYKREDYEAWREAAKVLMEEVKAGRFSVEEFEERIRAGRK